MKRSFYLNIGFTLALSLIALPTLAKPKEALWGDPIPDRAAQPNNNKPKASALGGPITPTQPNPLLTDPELSPRSSINNGQAASFVLEPVQPASSNPPIPLLNDPPKPSGARFIRVRTD
jgi:hypothetical protein